MVKNRIILVSIVCFSIAGFAGQTRQGKPPGGPRLKKSMTEAEKSKFFEPLLKPFRQMEERDRERRRLMSREAWKRLFRISERQWKIIEPKITKEVYILAWRISMRTFGSTDSAGSFRWKRPSRERVRGFPLPNAPARTFDELTEGEKIVEELIDVLEDENSKDEEIRQKRDALQQFREKARREFAKVRQEMAAVLTTPRQQAVLLLMGYID
ncbi:MAG: hypothetical protein IIB56_14100 [Planctomycetes bacterium]|nr:hypothetical protein [Planctomycetota bacterium]